jgi:hypothetical protein
MSNVKSYTYSDEKTTPKRSDHLPPGVGQKIAALLAGAGSFVTTLLFMWAVGLPSWQGIIAAAIVEFVLTMCKDQGGPVAWFGHGADTLLNGGGIFPYVLQLDKTPPWQMLVAGLGLDGNLRSLPALVLALAAGLLLSLAPLALWRGRRRREK